MPYDDYSVKPGGVEGSVAPDGRTSYDFPVKVAGEDYVGTRGGITIPPGAPSNDQVYWRAVNPGPEGNNITIEYVDQGNRPLRAEVNGDAITFFINAGTTTAFAIADFANEHSVISRMVTGSFPALTDGSGAPAVTGAAVPLVGGANFTRVRVLYVDANGHITANFAGDVVGTPGTAIPTQGLMVGGTDGGGLFRDLLVSATGELQVVQPTAANLNATVVQAVAAQLNCTEASAAAILAAALIIADAIGVHDNPRATSSILLGLRAHSGNPAPVSADDEQVDALATLLGQWRVYLDSALNRTNDEVKNEPIPPPEIVAHGVWVPSAVAIGNTTQLTPTSVECGLVVICPDPYQPGAGPASEFFWGGFSYTSGNGTIVAAGPVPANGLHRAIKAYEVDAANILTLYECTPAVVPVDDPSKIYGACSVLGAGAPAHRAFYWTAFGKGHVVGGT